MSEWLSTALVALTAIGVIFGPGLLPAYALGFRGLVAWGSAPLIGGAVMAVTAILTGRSGIAWSIWWVALASVLTTLVCLLIWYVAGRRRSPYSRGRVRSRIALVVGVTFVLAVGMQTLRVLRAIGSPDMIAQTFDTDYHLDSVAKILQTGDASTLHMTLTVPGASWNYYPNLWHEIVALVVQISGGSIPAAANWVTVVVTSLVWTVGMLALVRVLFGPRLLLLGVTAPVAFAFTQFPDRLLGYGLLYPNILSYAYLPAMITMGVLCLIRTHGRGRLPGLAGILAGAVAIGVAQPNGLFALIYIGVPLLVFALIRGTLRLRRRGRSWIVVILPWLAAVACSGVAYYVVNNVGVITALKGRSVWDVKATPWRATVEALELTAMHPSAGGGQPSQILGTPNFVVAALVLIGLVACFWVARWRWLPFSYVAVVLLYILVRGCDIPLRADLGGYWYCDPQRIAALLPIIGVPLVIIGLGAVCKGVLTGVNALRYRNFEGVRPRISYGEKLIAVAVIAIGVCLLLPRTPHYQQAFAAIKMTYTPLPDDSASSKPLVLDDQEIKVLNEAKSIIPEGVTVAGDPKDGSSLVWAIDGREAIYPHAGVKLDPDRDVVAGFLKDAKTDPRVCPAVRRLNLGYVLDFGTHLWDDKTNYFHGIYGIDKTGVGELVLQDGDAKLYKITACGPIPATSASSGSSGNGASNSGSGGSAK